MTNQTGTTQGTAGARAIARIQAVLGSLVASERRVAEVVLADPRGVIGSTASQLGARAGTSATTVIRFARNVGFSGYQELAITLAISEPAHEPQPALSRQDSPAETLRGVAVIGAESIAALPGTLDPDSFEGAVHALAGARHTLVVGSSLTAPVAADLAYRLNHLGLAADAPSDGQIQRIRATHLGESDVCVAILHGGTYPRVVDVARAAKASGARVIGITSFRRTPLADLADFPLTVGANVVEPGIGSWASRLAFLALVDALTLSVVNTDPARHTASLEQISELIEKDFL